MLILKAMEENLFQSVARQLRQPHGEYALKVGESMNEGNRLMYEYTYARLRPRPGDAVLEIGMGNGHFVKELFALQGELSYTGYDFSAAMVTEANRRNEELVNNDKARFLLGAAGEMPFEQGTFDKVFTINTLYFWENPVAELAEIKRVLKADGQLFLSIRPQRVMQHYPFTQYGFKLYSADEAAHLLQQNGLKVTELAEFEEPDFLLDGRAMQAATVLLVAGLNE